MLAQTALLAALAVVACLGPAQAIDCYECFYADKNPDGIGFDVPFDERCGSPLGEGLPSKTFPDTSLEPIVPFGRMEKVVRDKFRLKKTPEIIGASETAEGYKVYCAVAHFETGENDFGHVYWRGIVADDYIIRDECNIDEFVQACTCSTDGCNDNSLW